MNHAVTTAGSAAMRWLAACWNYIRAVSGDDAYERYLAHHATSHPEQQPMSRKDFFIQRQERKWTGTTRCC
ncbi:MAG TPA: YbdD/YjiX family protein [Steroidobacteraceae bacterium]